MICHTLVEIEPKTKGDNLLVGTIASKEELSKGALMNLVEELSVLCKQLKTESIEKNTVKEADTRTAKFKEIYEPGNQRLALDFMRSKVRSQEKFCNGQLLADIMQRKISKKTATLVLFDFTTDGVIIRLNTSWAKAEGRKTKYMREKIRNILVEDEWLSMNHAYDWERFTLV